MLRFYNFVDAVDDIICTDHELRHVIFSHDFAAQVVTDLERRTLRFCLQLFFICVKWRPLGKDFVEAGCQ